VQWKEQVHKMAEANKAYAHYASHWSWGCSTAPDWSGVDPKRPHKRPSKKYVFFVNHQIAWLPYHSL
jgi:hypothetical protein